MLAEHYKTLGIPINADLAMIKKAYRYKAKQFHPDINTSGDAPEKFIDIHHAYQNILNYKTNIEHEKKAPYYSSFQEQREAYINDQYRKWLLNELRKSHERVQKDRMRKKKLYQTKRDKQFQSIGDIIAISAGIFIFTLTIVGIYQNDSDIRIFAAILTIIISFIMISYPIYYRKKQTR